MTGKREIFAVRPAIEKEEAEKLLAIRSFLPPFRKLYMDKVELVHLPHYLFEIEVEWKGKRETVEAAVDAVLGNFAHWKTDKRSIEPALDTGFDVPFLLDPEEALKKLMEQHRWELISAGMKLRKRFEVKSVSDGPMVYYPFWTGIYKTLGRWRLEVVDAVTGARQGGKVRDPILRAWTGKSAGNG